MNREQIEALLQAKKAQRIAKGLGVVMTTDDGQPFDRYFSSAEAMNDWTARQQAKGRTVKVIAA